MDTFKKVKQIAKANEDGFTISLIDFSRQVKGWSVAMEETQNSFGDDGLKRVIEVATRTTQTIGGWKEQGQFYYDAVMIVESREEAIALGIKNKQLAIFNLETKELVYL